MHLDDERVERLRHGELDHEVARAARAHLAGCDACRNRVEAAAQDEAEIHGLLRAMDHPAPAGSSHDIVARAGTGSRGWARFAAAAAFALLAAGAAYAAAVSPLPGWIRSVLGRESEHRRPAPAAAPGAPLPETAGVAVDAGRPLVVSFASWQVRGRVRVTLDDGDEIRVRAPSGAARFTSKADRLLIDNRGSTADYELVIPRQAPRVEIEVAGERRFLKQGSRITPGGDEGGPFLVPLSRPDADLSR